MYRMADGIPQKKGSLARAVIRAEDVTGPFLLGGRHYQLIFYGENVRYAARPQIG